MIISEPSNPWIAGVAALFTREFFAAARAGSPRVASSANGPTPTTSAIRISGSIIATFISVFPHGTVWLIGGDDVPMMASDGRLDERLGRVRDAWSRPGVAEDLALVSVVEPFSLWSLYAGGPPSCSVMRPVAPLLADDTMRLEFSAPRELHNRTPVRTAPRCSGCWRRMAGPA